MNKKHINKSPIFCKSDSTKSHLPCESDSTKNPPPCEIESQISPLLREAESKSPLPCGGGLGVGKIGYKQTNIGIIPQDWEVVRLGEVCDFIKTYQNARSDLSDYDEINYIHYGEIHTKYKHFIDFSKAKLPKINAQKLAKEIQEIAFCQNGDLVVVDASEDYTAIAKSAEIQNLDSIAVAGLHTFLLRDKAKHFVSGFKGYILYNSEVYKELKRLATGISVLSVSKANLSNLQIPLPPLKEQEKIARILGVWDSAIDSLANLIKAKRKYKTALMQRLLTPPKGTDCETKPQITPSLAEGARGWVNPRNDKFMDCHENPYGFSRNDNKHRHTTSPCHTDAPLCHTEGVARSIQKENLQDNAGCLDSSLSTKAQNDKENTHNNKQKIRESSLRFAGFSDKWQEFRLGDLFEITRGYVLPIKEIRKQQDKEYCYPVYSSQTINGGLMGYYTDYLFENCITWTTDGANAGEVNFRAGKFYCTNVCGVLISKDGFANKCVAEIINSVSKKYVSYVGNPKLMNNIMSGIKVKIPTLAEQKKIAQVLSVCDKEIETLNLKFECLKAQKRGLMQQLLSGKVRVKC